ncbi:MAG: cupredoxin domain-containing protein [Gemmatimonadales bacterium]
MTPSQLVVTLVGLIAVVWVNYYFFYAAGHAAGVAAAAGGLGPQRIRIEVKGGYSPAVVKVRAGRPVRLDFFRNETNGCTEEVVLPHFGIRKFLPAHRTTAVEFTPGHAGHYEFTCGMGMVRGRIEVQS